MENKLENLPIIIDGPGNYLTRDGKQVVIHEIGRGTFPAKGSIFVKGRKPKYQIWHLSGRLYPLGTSNLDIVEKAGRDNIQVMVCNEETKK